MGELFVGIWRALTAVGRSFWLGTVEAWGYWLSTLLMLFSVLFAATMLNGIVWRLIESRLHPKLRDEEAEALLSAEIRRLKVEVYDAQKEQARLKAANEDQARVIEANRSWHRNWNADAHQATLQRRAR